MTAFNILNRIVRFFVNKISFYKLKHPYNRSISFNKIPHIIMVKSAKINIGNGTTINSNNKGYHINMFSKCKLYVDTPNAVIEIGRNCRIHGSCIHAQKKISIGNNVLIASNTQIMDSNGHKTNMQNPKKRLIERDTPQEITIEDNVWIGANCIILKGSSIGEGAIITAGSVIRGNVPSKSIYGGNPAKLIKQY